MQNVLDDVDYQTNKDGYVQEAESLSQLEMHVQLLYQARVDTRYEVEKLNEKESMELFFWHAFNKPTPLEEFACVSEEAARYCGGLPLALKVIGAYLTDKSTQQ